MLKVQDINLFCHFINHVMPKKGLSEDQQPFSQKINKKRRKLKKKPPIKTQGKYKRGEY